jgi:flagellar hook protein FlgE
MSIINNLYQGVSGLNANSTHMEVIGNNIANVNTVGFKAGRMNFEEVLGRSVLGTAGHSRIGNGVRVGGVEQVFSQGSFAATGQATDMAIAGEGFFMVRGEVGGTSQNLFTRAGQFNIDNEGFITTGGGLKLQGFQAGSDGTIGSKLGDVKLSLEPIPPTPSSDIQMRLGLDSSTEARTDEFDPENPSATSDFTSTVTVFDSLGNAHQVDVYVRKTGDNAWDYHALVPTEDTEAGGETEFTQIGSGSLTFNSEGQLETVVGDPLSVAFDGAAAQSITLDFGTSLDDGGDGSSASEQFEASGNQTLSVEQDGRSSGVLQGIRVDADGTIIGAFSNGEELNVGRVALARFAAPSGLENIGGNFFRANGLSGDAVVGTADSGGRGAIVGAALEQSNVDLASEFVQLITAQRGFQANARTITTADEVYVETVNLKR